MTKSEDKPSIDTSAKNAVLQMITTMADTTWRMFVPTLGLLIAGIYLDKTMSSFPWMTLVGFVVGGGISALLIRNQFRKS